MSNIHILFLSLQLLTIIAGLVALSPTAQMKTSSSSDFSNVKNQWEPADLRIIFVIGYVHGHERWTQGLWEESSSDKLFSWKKTISQQGHRIAFLGCRVKFWGDIAGNMVRALQRLNGARCILYIGKLGSLRAEYVPNHWFATGCQSVIRNELITSMDSLESHLQFSPNVAHGVHCTLGSVLDGTKDWQLATEKQYDFVDPEIGHMAKASLGGSTKFGYLHNISGKLARKYIHDLSNERLTNVLECQKQLVSEIQYVFRRSFHQWSLD